jgi:hypothetical protein
MQFRKLGEGQEERAQDEYELCMVFRFAYFYMLYTIKVRDC